MPLYEVQHSYPLTTAQKTTIAEQITHLHSSAFLTPSLFVHVLFKSWDASVGNYFLAGKRKQTSTNRIIGMVRTSPSRTKEDFDNLAEKIEGAWYDVVNGGKKKKDTNGDDGDKSKKNGTLDDEESETEKLAKRLLVVAFYSMVGIREDGMVVPSAGEEAAWFKEMKPEFERKAENGQTEYKDMLEEVGNREDLRKAYGA